MSFAPESQPQRAYNRCTAVSIRGNSARRRRRDQLGGRLGRGNAMSLPDALALASDDDDNREDVASDLAPSTA
jgi:hypothetical protein